MVLDALKIGEKKIKQESSVCFLGVLLDSTLSWRNHLTELSKKFARTAGIYAPFLSYGVSVWGLTLPSLLDSVSILQKKVSRIIVFSEKTAPSAPIFDSLRILKLNDIITYQITSFVFECMHNLAPSYFHGFTSTERIHNIGTRQSIRGELFALRCNTTQYGLRSIHYSGVRLWNSLPLEIRNSSSLSSFKNKLKNVF